MMRSLAIATALYAAFMLGRWYAPRYDTPAPVAAEWSGPEMESEVPYAAGYEAGTRDGSAAGYETGYRDGMAQCGAIPSISESEMVEVGYDHVR